MYGPPPSHLAPPVVLLKVEFVGCSGVQPIEYPPELPREAGVVYLPVSKSGRLRLITASPRVDSIKVGPTACLCAASGNLRVVS